jgi:hypothetical protein
MVINLSFKNTFNGVVFAEGHFGEDECKWRGNGGHYLLVVVPLDYSENGTKTQSNTGFCGLSFNQVWFRSIN